MNSYIAQLASCRALALAHNDFAAADQLEQIICRSVAETAHGLEIQATLLGEYLEGSNLFHDRRDVTLADTMKTGAVRVRLSTEKPH